jgi:hypothetical protein
VALCIEALIVVFAAQLNVEAVEKPLSYFGTLSYLKEKDFFYVNSS